MGNTLNRLAWNDRSGAVAPTVALSLFGLIAAGGLAFDYARMASMDTELQNAADQAALAAASQLDGTSTACVRAGQAARSLIANRTRMANDASGLAITVANETICDATGSIKFYRNADRSGAVIGVADFAAAKFVEVTVGSRTAKFALTPITDLLSSGAIGAKAYAGLGSAICKVPPVMMCNPDEPVGNTNINYAFDANGRRGRGLKLVSVGNGSSAWAPGNFGYLDTGSSTANPNVELREALGWISAPGDCSSVLGVKTRTGAGTPVTQAINTRFDIYERANNNAQSGKGNNGNGNNASCPTGGLCPPSINAVKDLLRKGNASGGDKCGFQNNEWELPNKEYLPTSATADLDTSVAANRPDGMGHPRDKCHAVAAGTTGECTGPVGNGAWDRNAYFFTNYGWNSTQWPINTNTALNPLPSSPTRYEVYLWEIAHRGEAIGGKTILAQRALGAGPAALVDHDAPVCSALQTPNYGSGLVPGGSTVDRRRISAAVINCNAYNVHGGGGTVYPVLKWVEFFLVEPSANRTRTDANDVYAEVIGETTLGGPGATAGQVVRRDVPYLIE
jgi:Flp pilus assembly protein TadG